MNVCCNYLDKRLKVNLTRTSKCTGRLGTYPAPGPSRSRNSDLTRLLQRDGFAGRAFGYVGYALLARRRGRGTRRETWVYVYMCVCECVRVCRLGVGEVFIVIVWPTRRVLSRTHSSVLSTLIVLPLPLRLLPPLSASLSLSSSSPGPSPLVLSLFYIFHVLLCSSPLFFLLLRCSIVICLLYVRVFIICVFKCSSFSSSLFLSLILLAYGRFSFFGYFWVMLSLSMGFSA